MSIRPIHISPESKLTFFENEQGAVEAEVGDVKVPVFGWKSDEQLRSLEKVVRLLRNWHFYPVFQAEHQRVQFIPIPPKNKQWSDVARLDIPDDALLCCRSNNTLSFAVGNTVTIWDPLTNKKKLLAFPCLISTLAEDPDGRLWAGGTQGQMHCEDQREPIACGMQLSIETIQFLTASKCLVKCSDKKFRILDINTKQIKVLDDDFVDCLVLENQIAFCYQTKVVFEGEENPRLTFKEATKLVGVCKVSETTLLIATSTGRVYFWDISEKKPQQLESNSLVWNSIGTKKVIVIDRDIGAIPYKASKPGVKFFFFKTGKILSEVQAGNWGILSMTALSDGSVMFATDTRGSGIHLAIPEKSECILSSSDLAEEKCALYLKELNNGFVVVRFAGGWVKIIQPINTSPEQMEIVTREDAQNAIFRAKTYQEPESYLFLLAFIESAVKNAKFYLARRLYETARQIQPANREASDVFLFYLEGTQQSQMKRRALLDWHALNDDMVLVSEEQQKPCKRRLFVGEGDFAYTEALLKKHSQTYPSLARFITATEYQKPTALERISRLTAQGVRVLSGIDATKIHQTFERERYQRIHWNFPYPIKLIDHDPMITNFFKSCSALQMYGDRVHLTLMQEPYEHWKGAEGTHWKTRQTRISLVSAASNAGYRLVRKRKFGPDRYPGYQHVKTDGFKPYDGNAPCREFIFQKIEQPHPSCDSVSAFQASNMQDPSEKEYKIETDKIKTEYDAPKLSDYYFACSSDEDSSDYEEDD